MYKIIWLITLVLACMTNGVVASTDEFDITSVSQQSINLQSTPSLNAGAIWQDLNAQVETGCLDLTEHHVEAIQQCLEAMKVEDLPHPGTHPEANSSVIRRSWHSYISENKDFQSIIFCSGHTGGHRGTFDTQQGSQHYMIDECWFEVHPDAVLNCKQRSEMLYFPSRSANLIVFDDERFFHNDNIGLYWRILKVGGKLVFKPGSGMGWPSLHFSWNGEAYSSECGRYISVLEQEYYHIQQNPLMRKEFTKAQIIKANSYYKNLGFSRVEYDKDCIVLVK